MSDKVIGSWFGVPIVADDEIDPRTFRLRWGRPESIETDEPLVWEGDDS